nr:MAG TPA: hypothetical protein [Crassvirales sp.]
MLLPHPILDNPLLFIEAPNGYALFINYSYCLV